MTIERKPIRPGHTFTIRHTDGLLTVVIASNDAAAKREAMIERWGRTPTGAVPHAPAYHGYGLSVASVE